MSVVVPLQFHVILLKAVEFDFLRIAVRVIGRKRGQEVLAFLISR